MQLSPDARAFLDDAIAKPDVSRVEPVQQILRGAPEFSPADQAGLIVEGVQLAQKIPRWDSHLEILAQILPKAPSELAHSIIREEVANLVSNAEHDKNMVASALQAIAPSLTSDETAEAVKIARTIADPQARALCLIALAITLPTEQSDPLLQSALIASTAISDESTRERLDRMIRGARQAGLTSDTSGVTRASLLAAAQSLPDITSQNALRSALESSCGVSRFFVYHCFPDGEWNELLQAMGDTSMAPDASRSAAGTQRLPNDSGVRLFVSHAEVDARLAKAVVQFFESALDLEPGQIRCTSVAGHAHDPGTHTSATLQAEIRGATAVVGLITSMSLQSHWVLFELGAAWGLGVPVIAMLLPDIAPSQLPGPLREHRGGTLTTDSYLSEVLEYLHRLGISKNESGTRVLEAIKALVDAGKKHQGRQRRRMRAAQAPSNNAASVVRPKMSPQVTSAVPMSEADQRILLEAWFNGLSRTDKRTKHAFADIDRLLETPAGATRRHIGSVLQELGYRIKSQGEQYFMAESTFYDGPVAGGTTLTGGILDKEW